eukprot:COSAG02_NODE_1318_length_13293_cov_39.414886_7_plen_258_part_00
MLLKSARRHSAAFGWSRTLLVGRSPLALLPCRWQCTNYSGSTDEGPSTAVTEATSRWIESMVVGLGLCPFTKPLRKRPHALRLRHCFATNDHELVQSVDQELQLLQPGITGPDGFAKHPSAPTPETTLLVVAPWNGHYTERDYYLRDFRAFLNAAWAVESRIESNGLADHIQLACFHPQAVFNTYADLAPTTEPGEYYDPAQFAIRSPYPTFHFLRARDIAAAVDQAPSAANIPDVNKRRLRELGPVHARALFEDLL